MNWAFTYANLEPYGLDSPEAKFFLATNLGFFLVGGGMATTGEAPVLGAMCELAGSASCWYHYTCANVWGCHPSRPSPGFPLTDASSNARFAGRYDWEAIDSQLCKPRWRSITLSLCPGESYPFHERTLSFEI